MDFTKKKVDIVNSDIKGPWFNKIWVIPLQAKVFCQLWADVLL